MGFSGRASGGVGSECVMEVVLGSGAEKVTTVDPCSVVRDANESMEISSSTVGSLASHVSGGSGDALELTPEGRPLPIPEEVLVQAVPGNPSTLRLTWFYDEEVLEQLASPDHPLRRLTFEVRQQSEAAKGHRRTRIHACSCRGLSASAGAPERDVGEQEFEVRGCTPGRNYFFSVRAVGEFEAPAQELRQVRSEFSEVVPWLSLADVPVEPAAAACLDQSAVHSPTRMAPSWQSSACLAETSPQSECVDALQADAVTSGTAAESNLAGTSVGTELHTRTDANVSTADQPELATGDAQARLTDIFREAKEATRTRMMEAVQTQMQQIRQRAEEACRQNSVPSEHDPVEQEQQEGSAMDSETVAADEQMRMKMAARRDLMESWGATATVPEEIEKSSQSRQKSEQSQMPRSAFAQAFTSYCVGHGQPSDVAAGEPDPSAAASAYAATPGPALPSQALMGAPVTNAAEDAVPTEREVLTPSDMVQAAADTVVEDDPVSSATVDAVRPEVPVPGPAHTTSVDEPVLATTGSSPAHMVGCSAPVSAATDSLQTDVSVLATEKQDVGSKYSEHMHEASLLTTEFEFVDACQQMPLVVNIEQQPLQTSIGGANAPDTFPHSEVPPSDAKTCTAAQAVSSPTSAETTASSATPPPGSPKAKATSTTAAAPEGPLLSPSAARPEAEAEQGPEAAPSAADAADSALQPSTEEMPEQPLSPMRSSGAQSAGGHMDKWMSKILAKGPARRGEPLPPKKAALATSPRSGSKTAAEAAPASSPRSGSKTATEAAPASSPRSGKPAAAGRQVGEQITKAKRASTGSADGQVSPSSSPKANRKLAGQVLEQVASELRTMPRETKVDKDIQGPALSARAASGAAADKPDVPDELQQQLYKSNAAMQAPGTVADVRRLVTVAPTVQASGDKVFVDTSMKAEQIQPLVVHPAVQPLVVQAAETRVPLQPPAEQFAAAVPTFVKGETVHIWSNSQNNWMTDGIVSEVLAVPRMSEGPSPPAGVMMPAGAVRVTSSAGLKWIMPEMIASQIRKPVKTAFAKGDKVHVWSNSVNTWMVDGVVLEVCSSPLCSEGGSVPAGTVIPVGAVRVASSAGMKWIMPELIGIHLRKASDNIDPFTIVEGVKPQLAQEVQQVHKHVSNEQPLVTPISQAVPQSSQRQLALPTADDVGPTVMSLPKRLVRADSQGAGARAIPGSRAMTQPKTLAHSSAHQHGSSTPTPPNALAHPGAHQHAAGTPLQVAADVGSSMPLAGPTVLAVPKMVMQPQSVSSSLDNSGLTAPLAPNGPTVMALPKPVMPVSTSNKGAEMLSLSTSLPASGPTVLAVPKMVSPVGSPDRDAALGPSNPTVMALPTAADVLKASSFPAQQHAGVDHHSRGRSAIPQLPLAPNVMPPSSSQPGTQWFNLEAQNRPDMSQRALRANELQHRLMGERAMGYPMPSMPEAPQFPVPQVQQFQFNCNPPPAAPAGPSFQTAGPTMQFDLSHLQAPPSEHQSDMFAPVGAYGGGNIGGSCPYTIRVLTSNSRWEELYFSATDDMEEVGAIFLRTHGLKDAFLYGLVDAMRGLVASGQAATSVDVIDLL